MNRKILLTALILLTFSSGVCYSAVQGEIVTVSGVPNEFHTNLGEEIVSDPLGQVKTTYSYSGRYKTYVECPDGKINGGYEIMRATTPLQLSTYEQGYLKLSEELDAKVEIYTGRPAGGGAGSAYASAPFGDVSNNVLGSGVCTPPRMSRDILSGGSGKITFKVRKPIVNGLVVSEMKVADVYARFGRLGSGSPSSSPVASVFINSFILRVPDKCVFNNGELISIEFGEVASTGLNGTNYQQPVPIKIQCQGVNFESGSASIALSISGKTTPFSNELLNTDKADLGILLKRNGQIISPGVFYPLPNMSGNTGSWDLIASPIANTGTEISEGEFNASATIVAKFQ